MAMVAIIRFFTTSNKCTILASTCSRLITAYCGEWVQTKQEPDINKYFKDEQNKDIKTCTIVNGRAKESNCIDLIDGDFTDRKKYCEELFNITLP